MTGQLHIIKRTCDMYEDSFEEKTGFPKKVQTCITENLYDRLNETRQSLNFPDRAKFFRYILHKFDFEFQESKKIKKDHGGKK